MPRHIGHRGCVARMHSCGEVSADGTRTRTVEHGLLLRVLVLATAFVTSMGPTLLRAKREKPFVLRLSKHRLSSCDVPIRYTRAVPQQMLL
jgi:hypothetical protein